ncbi:MAG: SUMF1/EgtB/PvdO family nonheme iron enzyme [Nitrospinae bacterium]|nr:SUMF1/EgtB/PvdO family nonheme iron enzyme [Nitrospinota bacterium]
MYRHLACLIPLCALLMLSCAPAAWADYGAGQAAWKAGRYAEAIEQWRASARKGDSRAMLALGRAFVKGVGVPQDYVEAHKWLNLAAAQGDAKAAAERDALAKEMTVEERAEARKLARAWRNAGRRRSTAIVPRRMAGKVSPGNAALRAVAAGNISTLEKALAAGADPNARGGKRGWTPLMYAADKGYTLLVPPLLKASAKPNLRAADGATALFIAALHGHSEIVELLMKAGADPRIKGPKGRTAWDVARKSLAVLAMMAFRDCPECPKMVVAPAGSFMMGSPSGEKDRSDDEGPRHRVTISNPFAVGKYEVTFAEWDACVADGGCGGHRPSDEGWGRGNRPVTKVSWEDAKAYVKWLSQKTGKRYRLLSEAEWEYAARAGTKTPFHFGSTISTSQANYDGDHTYGRGSKGVDRGKTVPVGSFPANVFGLHDVHGNVWEWVEDCWNDNYSGSPSDGSAWTSGNCGRRVLRGGSWFNAPGLLRSANRLRYGTGNRFNGNGFRVARTLAP